MNLTCHGAMLRVRRGAGNVWRCEGCGSHALIDSTLRKLLPPEVWQEVWPAILATVEPGGKPCPSCKRTMEHTREIAGLDSMQLDYCDPCRLIWLDPHEREKLPRSKGGHGISPELREAIREGGAFYRELESEVGKLTFRAMLEMVLWAVV